MLETAARRVLLLCVAVKGIGGRKRFDERLGIDVGPRGGAYAQRAALWSLYDDRDSAHLYAPR